MWNSDKNLTNLVYIDGQPKSMCWSYFQDYLIWEDCSIVKESSELWSLLVPLNSTKDILIGKIYSENSFEFGVGEEIHSVNVHITSENDSCFLTLEWTKIEKKDYVLFLKSSDREVSISSYETMPMCKENQPKNGTISEQYHAWNGLFQETQMGRYFHFGVKYFKPELSPLDPTKVKQKFLTNVKIYSKNNEIYANMSHWQGNTLPWKAHRISLDNNELLHGTCSFSLLVNWRNKTGTHEFLKWSLKYFSGRFEHGKLQGIASLITWNGAYIIAMFKDGELHGPAIAMGVVPIYDLGVINYTTLLLFKSTYKLSNYKSEIVKSR